jgi:hypothetical protein
MSGYTCITKLKRNDVQAHNLLDVSLRGSVGAVFELVRVSSEKIKPNKLIEVAEKKLVAGLNALRHYRGTSTVMVDLDRFPPGLLIHGKHPAEWGYRQIWSYGRRVIPVIGLHTEAQSRAVVFDAANLHQRGLCMRLDGNDLVMNAERTVRALNSLVRTCGTPMSDVDLLIDFGSLGRFPRDAAVLAVVRGIVLMDGYGLSFRSITCAGASIPTFITDVVKEDHGTEFVLREELAIWTRVSRALGWNRGIRFADYGIVHPLHLDIRNKYANAKLRYTTGAGTRYLRGCNKQKEPIMAQYPTLVRRLVSSRDYRGCEFSAADRFFGRVASGETNTGDTGRMVCYDLNHHLTYVAGQVSSILMLPAEHLASEERLDAHIGAH